MTYSQVLQRDFFAGLNKREITRIKHKTFVIKAFVVKNAGLCDITVEPSSIDSREKKIILKGFA